MTDLSEPPPEDHEANVTDAVLAALTVAGPRGARRSELDRAADVSGPTVRRYLDQLVADGVVVRAGGGRSIRYYLTAHAPSANAPPPAAEDHDDVQDAAAADPSPLLAPQPVGEPQVLPPLSAAGPPVGLAAPADPEPEPDTDPPRSPWAGAPSGASPVAGMESAPTRGLYSVGTTGAITIALLSMLTLNGLLVWVWREVGPGVAVTLGLAAAGATTTWLARRKQRIVTILVVWLQVLLAISLAVGIYVGMTFASLRVGATTGGITFMTLAGISGAVAWYWWGDRSRLRWLRATAVIVASLMSCCGGCAYQAWDVSDGFGTNATAKKGARDDPAVAVEEWMHATFPGLPAAVTVDTTPAAAEVARWSCTGKRGEPARKLAADYIKSDADPRWKATGYRHVSTFVDSSSLRVHEDTASLEAEIDMYWSAQDVNYAYGVQRWSYQLAREKDGWRVCVVDNGIEQEETDDGVSQA